MEIVGDGLLDEVRHAVHDGGEEVTHTGDYLEHCHKLNESVYKLQKTPPKRQTMLHCSSNVIWWLHVTAYLPVLDLNLYSVTTFFRVVQCGFRLCTISKDKW